MAITDSRDPVYTIGKERVLIHGSFAPNGSSALAAAGTYGKGFTVSRTGVGTFQVTLNSPIIEHTFVSAGIQMASDIPAMAVVRDYDSSAGTIDIVTMTGETRGILLPLTTARELFTNDITNNAGNGGILASDSTPSLAAINAGTDQGLVATWAASNSDKLCWQVPLPPDLDGAQAMSVNFWAASGGATDTPTMDVEAFFGVGDTDAGGSSAALSSTAAEVSVALAAGDVPAPPSFLTITVAPGAHTTDTVLLYAVWLEYVASTGAGLVADIAADDNARVNFQVMARNTGYDF